MDGKSLACSPYVRILLISIPNETENIKPFFTISPQQEKNALRVGIDTGRITEGVVTAFYTGFLLWFSE